MRCNSLGRQTRRGTPKRHSRFRKRCSSLAVWLVSRWGVVLLLPSRPTLGAETGANSTSLAHSEPGAKRPTTRFKTQSVHSHTKRYEGASDLSRLHHWRESAIMVRSWAQRNNTSLCPLTLCRGSRDAQESDVCLLYVKVLKRLRPSPQHNLELCSIRQDMKSTTSLQAPTCNTGSGLAGALGIQTQKSCICTEQSRPASKHAACTTNIAAQALPLP